MKTIDSEIKKCIEKWIWGRHKKVIIFPFGAVGVQVKNILLQVYNIEADLILDNHLCKYNDKIKSLSFLENYSTEDAVLFLACTNSDIYENLKNSALAYVEEDAIVELDCMTNPKKNMAVNFKTDIGRHCYGPIVRNHSLIAKIGNFCSFAAGVDVVGNHLMNLITTSPEVYAGQIPPHERIYLHKRSVIGNDVWLGYNVTIIEGVNIGNGVIAGAGSIITKDVPDYAVVVGAPARVIRYRYTPEQIAALNKIKWWDWTDQDIRERYDDFYIPIDDFIQKYLI
ncbi:MAG: CatB-related O-acetyltransferase [Acetatifactor sp.]|nr:CatB-related O-acetyltransferase [Acetatifactor sp.]